MTSVLRDTAAIIGGDGTAHTAVQRLGGNMDPEGDDDIGYRLG